MDKKCKLIVIHGKCVQYMLRLSEQSQFGEYGLNNNNNNIIIAAFWKKSSLKEKLN